MTSPDRTLAGFNRDLVQDVLATAEANKGTTLEAFTTRMAEHLAEAGELSNAAACYHSAHGVEVSGYAHDEDAGRLDLFVTIYRQAADVATLTKTDLETAVRRLTAFATRCQQGYATQIEEALPAHDMALDVGRAMREADSIRLLVLTNRTSRIRSLPVGQLGQAATSCQVWDLERLHRLLNSGTLQEPIEVDFPGRFGRTLPCLSTPETDRDYSVLLTIIPADMLDSLYGEYGTRLLQLNVRSFLQAKGAVNRGIRDTLLNNPERFLAYNNGISATASSVELSPDGSIVRLRDLQIVNGGQTTASIHSARRHGGADLSQVYVQAKLTVVKPESLDVIVPSISRYSNTQNKVTTADFSSNAGYHVELERLSRATWAPSGLGDGQDVHWFYERARGQYADELGRQGTPARQRAWKTQNPMPKKFTKTDLAKFENSHGGQPHMVSRGAEKNFYAFMQSLGEKPELPTAHSYRDTVAKAVLFRATEAIVSAQDFQGYRVNVVAYTIARLTDATGGRLDLGALWKNQKPSPALAEAIADLCRRVRPILVAPPGGGNVGEWCKRPDAWTRVKAMPWQLPPALAAELTDTRARRVSEQAPTSADAGSAEAEVAEVPAATWDALADWGRGGRHLTTVQATLANTLARRAERGEAPNAKMAAAAASLLRAAAELGFIPPDGAP